MITDQQILVGDTWVSKAAPSLEVTVMEQNDRRVKIARGLWKEDLKRADFLARYQFSHHGTKKPITDMDRSPLRSRLFTQWVKS